MFYRTETVSIEQMVSDSVFSKMAQKFERYIYKIVITYYFQ